MHNNSPNLHQKQERAKIHRLRKSDDFRMLMRRGRRVETPLFLLIYRTNGLSYGRFAFIAPRALDRRATRRNLLRRRAREWIRTRSEIRKKPYDAVLCFKKESLFVPRRKFYEELEKVLSYLK